MTTELLKHRRYVGPPHLYDLRGGGQFALLFGRGLREHHYVLDIGCGPLRAGRFILMYLRPGHYFGIEPRQDVLDAGIVHEVGHDLIRLKKPVFGHDRDFGLSRFGVAFDYILAQSIFTHAAEAQIRRCLSEVRKCLRREGQFLFDFRDAPTDNPLSEWAYPSMVGYSREHILEVVRGADLVPEIIPRTRGLTRTWVSCRINGGDARR